MKDLLRKEHYCSKIYRLLIKKSVYPLSTDKPLSPEMFSGGIEVESLLKMG